MPLQKLSSALMACCMAGPALAVLDPAIEGQISTILAGMSLEEKVGQMLMVQETRLTPGNIRDYNIGSLLLTPDRQARPESAQNAPLGWADYYDTFQQAALTSSSGIPLIIGVDAVHGHGLAIGATIIPHNINLGAVDDPDLMYSLGQLVAREVAATGCDWILAPTVAVNRDIRWGRTYESWGETPRYTEADLGAFIAGVQAPYNGQDAIAACAKHFIADGGAVWGTGDFGGIDRGNVDADEATLRERFLPPYLEAIENGVASIMVSYGSWMGTEMHHEKYLLTDVLKTELGFEGFIVSDYNGFYDVPVSDKEAVESTVNAGVDLLMVSDRWATVISDLKALVNEERVSIDRVNDAVRRILRAKIRFGLFENPLADRTPAVADSFGSPEHRQLAREAVRKSLVLLKNSDDLLPLDPSGDYYVVGYKAADIGVQCGGWTVDWQGLSGREANAVITGTTVLGGIQELVGGAGGTVIYDPSGTNPGEADAIIAVVGELPSAEWFGDKNLPRFNAQESSLLEELSESEIPIVVVVVASRPYEMQDWIRETEALVMAGLPGTEGGGVADGLFGVSAFTGELPVTWFKSSLDLPQNLLEEEYNPLYPRGFHLNTSDAFHILTRSLIPAATNEPLAIELEATSPSGTTWRVAEGKLPEGFTLTADGILIGSSSTPQNNWFRIEAVDTNGVASSQAFGFPVIDGWTYSKWAATIAWMDDTQSGRNRDPDADGFINLVELLLGQNPLAPDPPLPFAVSPTQITLSFEARADLVGIEPVIFSSNNLLDWVADLPDPLTDETPDNFTPFSQSLDIENSTRTFLILNAETDR